ncbi:MAG: hypothetical protein LBH91_03785 [Prevotellaceae bacterium]|jgi:hypothetical protein|nr:hypothetical protein [Prevotellaceae bacterium]
MKRILFFTCFITFLACSLNAQTNADDYTIIPVDKRVREFANPNDNKTPLNAFITYIYTVANGKWQEVNSLSSVTKKRNYSPEFQEKNEWLLDYTIKEIIMYKDSVVGVIPSFNKDPWYTIWFFYFENGRWVNIGENIGKETIEDTRQLFLKEAITRLEIVHKVKLLDIVSTDTSAFVRYLQEKGKEPVPFLLNALSHHKLVVYGEIHNQKASWDLLRALIRHPEFTQSVGTVFLELSKSAQANFDSFFNNKTKEPEIILDILRNEEWNGWPDTKDMFEFILDLWDINEQLAPENRIKALAIDFQRPFHTPITTKEQYDAFYEGFIDRNLCMADIIEGHIKFSADQRNALFIVGSGHAYKSSVIVKSGYQQTGRSAVSLLLERLPKESIFSIIIHSPMVSNNGYLYGKLRKGLFDYVFANTGNQPVAFNLQDSPFGRELFDGCTAIAFRPETGTYEDNYDAYIFLEAVEEEVNSPLLYELYSDEFVEEIKRRAQVLGYENDIFWGIKVKDLTRGHIISRLKAKENCKRWNFEGK